MKANTFALASTLSGSALAAIDPSFLSGLGGMAGMMGGGIASAFTANIVNSGYGKTGGGLFGLFGGGSASGTPVPQTARFARQVPGSKTVKMKYGPYNVPNMNHKNGLGEAGSLWNYPDKDVAKPCDKCVIVGMNAGLEYPSGKVANIDTGAWLHHFVLFNIGPGRTDATCYGKPSLPHANVDSSPGGSERMFSSGNERTPAFMYDWASGGSAGSTLKPVGYHIRPTDKFAMILDLMNDNSADFTAYLTITFDYVDGWPAGMDDMRPVWFDIDQCGLSEVMPRSQTGAFTVSAWAWPATMNGEILGYAGHLHDGGQRVVLTVDGSEACSSRATYGGDPAYIAPMGGNMNMKSATTHISHMSICQGPTLKTNYMKKGQMWTLAADYDYSKNKGVLEDNGLQASIMGIAIMYVRQPFSESTGSSWF